VDEELSNQIDVEIRKRYISEVFESFWASGRNFEAFRTLSILQYPSNSASVQTTIPLLSIHPTLKLSLHFQFILASLQLFPKRYKQLQFSLLPLLITLNNE
jgi:hypothetical protein